MTDPNWVPSQGALSSKESLDTTLLLCLSYLEELNSPISLSIAIKIRYKEWDQLAQGFEVDPLHYDDPKVFFRDYQSVKLLMKADFLPTSFDRRKEALVRFERAESLCQETNSRWRSYQFNHTHGFKPDGDVSSVISDTKRQIELILGPFPAKDLFDSCRWGPGATSSIRNPRTSVYEKYLEPVTGSGPCLTLFDEIVRQNTLWHAFNSKPRCVSTGNKVVFVPKDAKTERSIAVEPSFDSYIQLGIGTLLKRRLRTFGVDLSSQKVNQDLARYGSLTGKVATIDLSMASDTVSKAVVDAMLPLSWRIPMASCRSTSWRRGGNVGVYHKFSSMGNGYTFELETLLFYSIAKAVCDYLKLPTWEVSVYGDDITIGTEGVDLLQRSLSFFGFSFNVSKSFSSGPFRESCGKDYFLGFDVRPYFVRSLLRDVRDVMKFHNGILKTFVPGSKTAAKALHLVRPFDRIFGPKALGDTVFHSEAPRGSFLLASKKFPMFEGYLVRHWEFKAEKEQVKFLEPAVLASLYNVKGTGVRGMPPQEASSPTNGFATLRSRGTWVTRTVHIPHWGDAQT